MGDKGLESASATFSAALASSQMGSRAAQMGSCQWVKPLPTMLTHLKEHGLVVSKL